MKLKDKIVIVTGAGSGIGRGIAELFAQEGAEVVTVGRTREKLDVAKQEAEDGGERLHPRALDVSDRLSSKSLVTATVAQFGRVDILVNNAGVNVAKRALAELAIEDFDKLVQVNLNGAFYVIHATLPVMRQQGGGLIINVSSVAGVRASELGGAAYAASKFGLSGLSKTIGVEERENGIRSCLIYPGEVNTPILDARPVVPDAERRAKMLQPEDLAQAALLMATLHPRATIPEMVVVPTLQRFE